MNHSCLTSSELLVILDIARRLSEQRQVLPLMTFVAEQVFHITTAERCLIVLFADDGTPNVRVARDRQGEPLDAAGDQMSHSILDHVRMSMKPLLVNDAQTEQTFKRAKSVHTLGLRSVMCVPLLSYATTVGAIYVENRRASGQFQEENLVPLALLSYQVVVALENARLYEALEAHAETLSRVNAELNSALRLKDEFLTLMSHELRTPLNVIIGISEGMQENVYGPMSERQQRAVAMVFNSGKQLLGILSDVLDLTRIQADAKQLRLEPLDVEEICHIALQRAAGYAQQKGVALQQNVTCGTVWLRADQQRLSQILLNLLDNAVKFTPQGGNVGLEVIADAAQEHIAFTVWDTGIGIAEEDMGRLFRPFSQVDARLSRSYEGIGLGLTLAYRLTLLHGGSVQLASTPGAGSRFTVTLPWYEHDQEPVATPAWATPLRILLADDNELTLELYTGRLIQLGAIVTTARSGAEALEMIRAQRPDVVLLAMQMRDLDGASIIRSVRSNAAIAGTPIIALTALVVPGDQGRGLAAGATCNLAKPAGLRTLQATITEVLTHIDLAPSS